MKKISARRMINTILRSLGKTPPKRLSEKDRQALASLQVTLDESVRLLNSKVETP